MWAIALGGIILTYLMNTALLNVRYAKLEIMADELEREKEMQENFERMKKDCEKNEKEEKNNGILICGAHRCDNRT